MKKTTKKTNSKGKFDIYEMVTKQITDQLEKGVIPWRKPWNNAGTSVNWVTQKPYRGINTLLLQDGGEYATFKQINDAGGRVKDGEHGHIVVYWLWKNIIDEETEEITGRFAKPFYYKVFEINTQVEGLKSKRNIETYEHNPIEKAEAIFKGYVNSPDYTFNSGKAVYYPTLDKINCPPIKDFKIAEEYYSTLFHEMVHSTGHKSRLHRDGITTSGVAFGDEVYSKEELVAELGASMLCGMAGIDNHTIENSASYIDSWLRALKNDKKLLIQASSQAQKAADYILGVTFEEEN